MKDIFGDPCENFTNVSRQMMSSYNRITSQSSHNFELFLKQKML